MAPLLAISPILLILALMAGAGWSAAAAGAAGLALTVAVALFAFEVGVDTVSGATLEAAFVAGTILWIVFPALCIHEMQTRCGALETVRKLLMDFGRRRSAAAVLVAWFFALFVEGAAGFGAPVALAAPLLVALGHSPVAAVSMALLGHAAGVSFGAVGTPVLLQLSLVSLDARALSGAVAAMHAAFAWALLLWTLRIAREGDSGGGRNWPLALGGGALFVLPSLAIAVLLGPELPTLGGALIGGAAFVFALRLRMRRGSGARSEAVGGWPLLRAALPYLIVVALILATRLPAPVREAANLVQWRWTFRGQFEGDFRPLYHPGTVLLLGFVLGGLAQGVRPRALGEAAMGALRRLPSVAVALLAMLVLSRLMVHAEMVDALATATASAFGSVWPIFVPAVGALGTFVTGSATASNILFTHFQQSTALALGLPTLLAVAGQSFGAAVGNVLCPHNIIAGGATVGLSGREGEVLRRTLLPGMGYALAGGCLLLVATWL